MSQALEKYLDRIMIYANRTDADAINIREELKDHILKKISDLQEDGLVREDAIFQAIEQHGQPKHVGYGLRKRWSLIDIRTKGTARGFIAVGPKAIGVIAMGGCAVGVITFAGIGLGIISLCGIGFGLIMAFSGIAIAPFGIAYGGICLGMVTFGGIAIGVAANGGLSAGMLTAGQGISYFTCDNAPMWLRKLTHLSANGYFIIPFMIFSYTVWIALCIAYGILNRKENNRIKNADPALIE